ncbi:MAG: arylamine N-acetyltransferase [Oscillospiraceae bacterium]|nr:arylamine N-acetyltransferase [Oscillospiraceae bacterium]
MNDIFSALYAPLSKAQTEEYLLRIGYSGVHHATKEVLAELMQCHFMSVPFENLDVYYAHKEPDLSTASLYDKIVKNRRGGYCFELNGLFLHLLRAFGFSCTARQARIIKGEFLSPPSHEVIVVKIDGKSLFCDVGFGGPVPPSPVEIICDSVQESDGRRYMFSDGGEEITLSVEKDGTFAPLMMFSKKPSAPVDFLPLNAFCAHSPIEPFIHKQMAWKRTCDGKVSIDGDIFRTESDGAVTEKLIETPDELRVILSQYFGIEYGL